MKKTPVFYLVFSSLMIALGVVLPFLTASNPQLGSIFLLMHIPALFTGLVIGPKHGLLVGVTTPLLRSVLFSMPPMFPQAVIMSFEIGAFGLFAGLARIALPKTNVFAIVSLIAAMLLGRVVYGLSAFIIYPLAGFTFGFDTFLKAAFVTGLPGIAIQLFVIPTLYIYLQRTSFFDSLNNAKG